MCSIDSLRWAARSCMLNAETGPHRRSSVITPATPLSRSFHPSPVLSIAVPCSRVPILATLPAVALGRMFNTDSFKSRGLIIPDRLRIASATEETLASPASIEIQSLAASGGGLYTGGATDATSLDAPGFVLCSLTPRNLLTGSGTDMPAASCNCWHFSAWSYSSIRLFVAARSASILLRSTI